MKLSNYTSARVGRLSKTKVPDIKEPLPIKFLWVRAVETHSKINKNYHKHSFYEAHFCIRGKTVYGSKDSVHVLTEGRAVVFSPEVSHKILEASDDFLRIAVAFSLPEDAEDIYEWDFDERTINDFNEILRETDNRDELSYIMIRDRLVSVLSRYIRHIHSTADSVADDTDIRIGLIKRYISDNKNVFLDSEDVAQYCHFNVKYLNRIFKKETGMTLLEYIHMVKSAEAERLLKDTDMTLEEIGEQLGFANVQYFNTFFKRYTSMTPGFYRKLSRKE